MDKEHREEMLQMLTKMDKTGAFTGRTVFLFGHNNATEETADALIDLHVVPAAILDNNVLKQRTKYRAIPVTAVEAVTASSENSMVLIASRYFSDMAAQLKRLGYSGEVIRLTDYDSFTEYSLTEDTLRQKTERAARGAATLTQIRTQFSPGSLLVICPYDALGDVYWAMAFLPAYCNSHHIGRRVVAVVGSGCRQTAGLFNESRVVTLSQAQMDELVQAVIFIREENCIIAHHDRPYTDNTTKLLNGFPLLFVDYYRRLVYNLPTHAKPAPPSRLAELDGNEPIIAGRTVIFAPYAKSVLRLPDAFWERLVKEWSGKGFHVCTYVNGDQRPISGTVPLMLPLNRLKNAAEHAGVFIGLRSGLCDIVHDANCQKIVVFPGGFYGATPLRVADFFHLPGWERILL
jgi:hypothetical protein